MTCFADQVANATRGFEVRPELAFMQLRIDHGGPRGGVMEPKGKPGGHRVRKALLATAFGPDLDASLAAHIAGGARLDDIIGAFAALWSTRRIAEGTARKAPDQEEIDVPGLPMAIRYEPSLQIRSARRRDMNVRLDTDGAMPLTITLAAQSTATDRFRP